MDALRSYAPRNPARLVFEDAPTPTPGPGDVLVRVQASGVSPGELDWPTAWLDHDDRPREAPITIGHEVSGVVVGVGTGALGLATGDEVFGFIDIRRDGADAEFVAVRTDELAPKPATLTHEEAAAVPLSGLTAWQALFDHGELTDGRRVLVHGAAGGVGAFAVQFARWKGADVTATASSEDGAAVLDLGADRVIDYRTERFEDEVDEVDLVLDTVGGETWERSWSVLRPGGLLVSVAVPRPPERAGDEGRKAIWFVVRPDAEQLMSIGALIDAGFVRPVISGTLPLAEGPKAYGERAWRGGPGKVVLVVAG